MTAGKIQNLSQGSSDLKVNDYLYSRNFKGDVSESQKMNWYVLPSLKLSQINTPVLGNYGIEPFLYLNGLLSDGKDYRIATAFGLSMQTTALAMEGYYTFTMLKNGKVTSGLQFNMGID